MSVRIIKKDCWTPYRTLAGTDTSNWASIPGGVIDRIAATVKPICWLETIQMNL